MRHKHTCEEQCASDGHIADERNRYFTGKYMTARDFRAEQDYFLSRHRAHNRILHGWGIVCGLGIGSHPRPECADRWIKINPGIALDCYGRELIVCEPFYYELPLPPKRPKKEALPDAAEMLEIPYVEPFLVALQYEETCVEEVASLYGEACEPTHLEANRVREGVKVVTIPLSEVSADCWIVPGRHEDYHCQMCDDSPENTCLEPNCPCGGLVPLVLVKPHLDKDNQYLADDFIASTDPAIGTLDTLGRRKLPTPPAYLTHIVGINWPHGGTLSREQLNHQMKGRLEIRFDRKILNYGHGENRKGVNGFTFLVTYQTNGGQDEYVESPEGIPPVLEDDCLAVFTIDDDEFKGREKITDSVIRVRLLCDFILDCNENAVDGNHLGGQLPSGDGVPGGVFESWFYLED